MLRDDSQTLLRVFPLTVSMVYSPLFAAMFEARIVLQERAAQLIAIILIIIGVKTRLEHLCIFIII